MIYDPSAYSLSLRQRAEGFLRRLAKRTPEDVALTFVEDGSCVEYLGALVEQIEDERSAFVSAQEELRILRETFWAIASGGPIPMFLTCPFCSTRHIDEGKFATLSHATHSCQECGLTWRPAVVATVGVRYLPGFNKASG